MWDKKIVVEVKTTANLPADPRNEHLHQIAYYVAYYPCDFGILHYSDYNRNTIDFIIKKTDKIVLDIKLKVDEINKIYNQQHEI